MAGTAGQVERRESGQDRILMNKMVTILSGAGGEVVTADTVNLGSGGMYVATDRRFGVGDRFICQIDLGDEYKPVLSGAEVRWLDEAKSKRGMGVRFLDIAEVANSLGGALPPAGPETVRVKLDSVGSSIEAEVIEREGGQMVIDLEIPFLSRGQSVDIGQDREAQSAGIREVEWVSGDGGEGAKVRLRLDLDRQDGPKIISPARPEPTPTAADDEAEAQGEPEGDPAAQKKARTLHKRKRKVSKASDGRESNWARRARMLNWRGDDDDDDEEPQITPETVILPSRPTQRAAAAEEPEVTVAGEVEEEEETPEPVAAVASASEQREAEAEAKEAEAEAKEAEAEAKEAEAENDEEIDPMSFDPTRKALERLLGAALIARLVAGLGKAREAIGGRLNGPKLAAAGQWMLAKLGAGWSWTKAHAGPAIVKLARAIRDSKVVQRRRRQSRGEPSKVVRNLTDRARKVAAGRGRTVALVVFITAAAAGLGTAGYGLWGSAEAEAEREQLQTEASSSGWSSERWQEPQPARSPNS